MWNVRRGVAGVLLAWLTLALPCQGEEQQAADLLRRFDADADGKLDRAELEQALAVPASAVATPATPKLAFLRVSKNKRNVPESLETAIVTFKSADGRIQVDLVGAVHIADKGYYEALNREFAQYDHVLYELVAPEGTRIPQGGRPAEHPVGQVQTALKSMLDLSFQLDEIDYTVPRLVHADLSPDEFAQSMAARGESVWQILLRAIGQASAQAQSGSDVDDTDILFALFAPDRSLRLKRVLATQFQDLERQMSVFSGPDGSTLITERNKRALQVLHKQLAAGDDRLAIFYGAGHMADMAERLQREFGLEPTSTRWLVAWNLADGR